MLFLFLCIFKNFKYIYFLLENLGFGCVDKFWLIFEESLSNLDIAGLQIFYRNDIDFNIDNLAKKWNLKVN